MDFGSVKAPGGQPVGPAPATDPAGAARRPAPESHAQAQSAAAQATSNARPPGEHEMRTVGDVQRLANFLRATAEETAAGEAGTEGEGGGSGPGADLEGGVAQMVNQAEKHAEKVFRSILDFAGEDRKLLEQARGFVNKVFEEISEKTPEPMLARLTQERVIELIERRLREMNENVDVDFSA